ncbi:hypothetical protein [Rhodococcus sp. SMB37]|uniref:hypothetical protein n=1 Tax=Rhodococcus sp. SMB37 TaxID=2512213 RepID=UPI000A7B6B2C|nr:hypothetical protein [Rhodococcus sp. SMB37]
MRPSSLLLVVAHARSSTFRAIDPKFRRVNGHLHLPALRAALDREVMVVHTDRVSVA